MDLLRLANDGLCAVGTHREDSDGRLQLVLKELDNRLVQSGEFLVWLIASGVMG